MAKGRPDFSPTAVDVVLRAEWAAQEQTDKDLYGSVTDLAVGDAEAVIFYLVPTGKTLFVTHFGGAVLGEAANIVGYLMDWYAGVIKAVFGGSQGALGMLNKPVRFIAGKGVTLFIIHYGTAARTVTGHIGGYEL